MTITVNSEYDIGDTVYLYGSDNRGRSGKVIKVKFIVNEFQYLVEFPNETRLWICQGDIETGGGA